MLKATLVIGLVGLAATMAHAQPMPSRTTETTTACVVPRALRALINPYETRRSDPGWVRYVVNDGQCSRVPANLPVTTWGTVDGITDIEAPRGSGRRMWVVSSSVAADYSQQPGPAAAIPAQPVQGWTNVESGTGPSAVCGLVGGVGDGTLSMTASADRPGQVSLVLRHPAWRFPNGGRVAVSAVFSDRVPMSFNGQARGDAIEISLMDDLRLWVHEFTAASTATLGFGYSGGNRWSLNLAGTTPAITAMAKCVEANPSITVPPPLGPVPSQAPPPIAAYQPSGSQPNMVADAVGALARSSAAPVQEAMATPAPQPPPPPAYKADPAPPPGETVLARWSGDSMMTTRPFHVDGPWELRWTTAPGFFAIHLHEVGSDRSKLVANQANAGSSAAYQPNGGAFYLEISGSGSWSIQAVSVPDDAASPTPPMSRAPAMARLEAVPAAPPTPVSPPAAKADPADAERQLVATVAKYADIYNAAPNDMLRGASRPARGKEICALLPGRAVTDWTGEIYKLSSNNDGKGVVEIRIGKDVYVKTWNNALSDISDHTLIETDTILFRSVSQLTKGTKVRFSGEFIRGDVDCLKEASMSVSGAMTEPEYIFRFTDIRPAD